MDEILENYFIKRAKAHNKHMNNHRRTPEDTAVDDSSRDLKDSAKQQLQALITEARIDELGKIDSRSFMSLGSDFVYTVYQSDLDKRIEQLKENK